MNTHLAFMQRAIALSENGRGRTSPNPIVGAVIIDSTGAVIAEGFHDRNKSSDHAEVVAIKTAGEKTQGSTIVVTLEPCNHTGKTGPCADALIAAGVDRVVFAATDPGAVSGGGAEKLATAGVEVIEGILEEEANDLIRIWRKSTELQRVFVTVKWASTLDGRTAANDGTSKWISGEEARFDVHMRRSKIDAIAVGTNTVVVDDPAVALS